MNSLFTLFELATIDEVRKRSITTPNKSCDLDRLPTTPLTARVDSLRGTITNIVKLSLVSGQFPDGFKHAHANLVLKKVSLPKDNLRSSKRIYKPSFVSKTLNSCNKSPQMSY